MPSTLDGYAALTEDQTRTIQGMGRFSPSHFGVKYLVLSDTPEMAVEKILQSTNNPPEAAQSFTDWIILRISLSADQVVDAFKAHALVRCDGAIPGWQFYGELCADTVAFEWTHLQVAPLGVAQWAEKCLHLRYTVYFDGACTGCGVTACCNAPVWAAPESIQYGGKTYCASCWNRFFITNLEDQKLFNTPSWLDCSREFDRSRFDTDESTTTSDTWSQDVEM